MRRNAETQKRRNAETPRRRSAGGLRRVAVITGSRAEYGLLRSTLAAIGKSPTLKLQLVVTGTHLLSKFGHTIDDVRRDGRRIDARVPMQRGDDSPLDQAEGLARGVAGIARFLQRARTDIVVVLGDRIEALAGALAGVTTGRLVAHVHGGDVAPGDFDDSLRHAITKLAHLHLVATEAARDRIIRMGENEVRVRVVGAPGLDRLKEIRSDVATKRRGEGSRDQGIKGSSGRRPNALIVQHPCGRAAAVEKRAMKMILEAADQEGLAVTCIYPNSDRGHRGIVEAIEGRGRRDEGTESDEGAGHENVKESKRQKVKRGVAGQKPLRVVRSLDHDSYLRLLVESDVLIGNSSSGMIEAAAAGTPAVNVGDRQKGRDCDPRFVIHVEETARNIRRGIRRALSLSPISSDDRIYGDGSAGKRIASHLAAVPLDDTFRRKVFADPRRRAATNRILLPSVSVPAQRVIQTHASGSSLSAGLPK